MHDNDTKLNRCRNLLAVPPKVDRNKTAPKCRCCLYFQPEFRYRKCLYASCPYGKNRNTAFRRKPLRSEKIVTGGGGMDV